MDRGNMEGKRIFIDEFVTQASISQEFREPDIRVRAPMRLIDFILQFDREELLVVRPPLAAIFPIEVARNELVLAALPFLRDLLTRYDEQLRARKREFVQGKLETAALEHGTLVIHILVKFAKEHFETFELSLKTIRLYDSFHRAIRKAGSDSAKTLVEYLSSENEHVPQHLHEAYLWCNTSAFKSLCRSMGRLLGQQDFVDDDNNKIMTYTLYTMAVKVFRMDGDTLWAKKLDLEELTRKFGTVQDLAGENYCLKFLRRPFHVELEQVQMLPIAVLRAKFANITDRILDMGIAISYFGPPPPRRALHRPSQDRNGERDPGGDNGNGYTRQNEIDRRDDDDSSSSDDDSGNDDPDHGGDRRDFEQGPPGNGFAGATENGQSSTNEDAELDEIVQSVCDEDTLKLIERLKTLKKVTWDFYNHPSEMPVELAHLLRKGIRKELINPSEVEKVLAAFRRDSSNESYKERCEEDNEIIGYVKALCVKQGCPFDDVTTKIRDIQKEMIEESKRWPQELATNIASFVMEKLDNKKVQISEIECAVEALQKIAGDSASTNRTRSIAMPADILTYALQKSINAKDMAVPSWRVDDAITDGLNISRCRAEQPLENLPFDMVTDCRNLVKIKNPLSDLVAAMNKITINNLDDVYSRVSAEATQHPGGNIIDYILDAVRLNANKILQKECGGESNSRKDKYDP